MRILQKLVLVGYMMFAFFISFVYVPYVCFFEDGIRKYNGHALRNRVANLVDLGGGNMRGFCTIDSSLMFVEIFAATVITVAILYLLWPKKTSP
jgi:hypothetical protein